MSAIAKPDYFVSRLRGDIMFAASVALNDAAVAARDELNGLMNRFEGGATPFMRKAFAVSQFARRGTPEARIEAQPKQAAVLHKALGGGVRKPGDYATMKRGVLVPGVSARPNRLGNLPRTYLKRLDKAVEQDRAKTEAARAAGKVRPRTKFRGEIATKSGQKIEGFFDRVKVGGRGQPRRLRATALIVPQSDYRWASLRGGERKAADWRCLGCSQRWAMPLLYADQSRLRSHRQDNRLTAMQALMGRGAS